MIEKYLQIFTEVYHAVHCGQQKMAYQIENTLHIPKKVSVTNIHAPTKPTTQNIQFLTLHEANINSRNSLSKSTKIERLLV